MIKFLKKIFNKLFGKKKTEIKIETVNEEKTDYEKDKDRNKIDKKRKKKTRNMVFCECGKRFGHKGDPNSQMFRARDGNGHVCRVCRSKGL